MNGVRSHNEPEAQARFSLILLLRDLCVFRGS